MVTWSISLAIGILAVGQSPNPSAVDLTKVERTIRNAPQFKTKAPRYCLLVFGPNADYRVWLVLDGDTLYVDRNGNGDLTEPGEATTPRKRNTDPCSFEPVTIQTPDGKTEEKLGFALYGWFDYVAGKDSQAISPSTSVTWKGRSFGSWGDETGRCVWGFKQQEAPILHIDGPLQMGFESDSKYVLERTGSEEFELNVGVGTKGLGQGAFVHLSYANNAIPVDKYPIAVLDFPNKKPGLPPVRVQAVLKKRC